MKKKTNKMKCTSALQCVPKCEWCADCTASILPNNGLSTVSTLCNASLYMGILWTASIRLKTCDFK